MRDHPQQVFHLGQVFFQPGAQPPGLIDEIRKRVREVLQLIGGIQVHRIRRAGGGLLYLSGMLIMAWNVVMTVKSGKVAIAPLESEVVAVTTNWAGWPVL